MNPEEKLVTVAEAFAARIAGAEYLALPVPIPVFTERKGDLAQAIATALNKLGVCVTIVLPDAEQLESRTGNLALRVRLVAQIDESAFGNRGNAERNNHPYRSALAVTTAAMRAVNRAPNGLDPEVERNGALVREHRAGLNEFELDEIPFRAVPDKKFVSYHLTAFTTVVL